MWAGSRKAFTCSSIARVGVLKLPRSNPDRLRKPTGLEAINLRA
jgi:hypothetical protein